MLSINVQLIGAKHLPGPENIPPVNIHLTYFNKITEMLGMWFPHPLANFMSFMVNMPEAHGLWWMMKKISARFSAWL